MQTSAIAKPPRKNSTAPCHASASSSGTHAMRNALSRFGKGKCDSRKIATALRRASRAQQQHARNREHQRLRESRDPAVSVGRDLAPDEMTRRDVERIGCGGGKDPRARARSSSAGAPWAESVCRSWISLRADRPRALSALPVPTEETLHDLLSRCLRQSGGTLPERARQRGFAAGRLSTGGKNGTLGGR